MDIGKYVIVRSNLSGSWAGTLASLDGTTVELTGARRLWSWWAAKGVSLSGVAAYGLHPDKLEECRIAVPVTLVRITDAFEIIEASAEARSSIEAAEAGSS